MFKKESDLFGRSKSKIQNKDIKKLRVDIIKSCHLSEDEINDFFNKKESVTQVKLANRSIIYEVNDIPMFYDKEGRGDFYPTIFLLWKCPTALRNVIIHSPVSEFILNGADLMLPGIAYLKSKLIFIFIHSSSYLFLFNSFFVFCVINIHRFGRYEER